MQAAPSLARRPVGFVMDRVINVARDPVNVGRPAESGIGNEVQDGARQ